MCQKESPIQKDQNELVRQRLENLKALKETGIYPYGGRYDTSVRIKDLVDDFKEGIDTKVAGRIMAMRSHGKSAFCDLRDSEGKIQIYLKADKLPEGQFAAFKSIDIGDIIGAEGKTFKTRTGEPTIEAASFTFLSKGLRPLPEKWHGLKDVETRYRQRYVDLIVNEPARRIFRMRSQLTKNIRDFLDSRGYLEVETPMMHPIPGGAAGKPFRTHHETLDMDLYLRIAPELYLKKLLVGGLERVYEINRSFRNEGISTRHNPEFTMLEVYTAYGDCATTMELTQELITQAAKEVLGKTQFEYQGKGIDLDHWDKISFAGLMEKEYGILPDDDEKVWVKKLKKKGLEIEGKTLSRTQLINIIGDLVTPESKGHPVFVVDLFSELCPLAKKKRDNPLLADRFELYIGGMEIANAYSELNDPIEQRLRFEAQAKDTKEDIDEDFIRALEYGMPPAGGLGIGIDRLTMILTDSASIRDVILFPQMRPEKG
ncbi:MAG: lysine--tRNA ligase [Candidatus Omnitrophica bacterium]|nr:lysine--tRNA ligase [Candidatus Omnitrophota bacterium]